MGEAPEGSAKIKNKLIFILYNFLKCTARREGLTHFMSLVSSHTTWTHVFTVDDPFYANVLSLNSIKTSENQVQQEKRQTFQQLRFLVLIY